MDTQPRTTSWTAIARLFALGLLPMFAHASPMPQYSSTRNTESSSDSSVGSSSLESSSFNSSSLGSSGSNHDVQPASTSTNSSSLVPLWGYCNGSFIGVSTPLPCDGGAQCICKDDSFAQCRVAVNGVWSWSPDWQCQQPGDTSHGLLSTYGMSNVSSQSTYTTPGNYGSSAATSSSQVGNSTTSSTGTDGTTPEISTSSGSFKTLEPGVSSGSGAGVTNSNSTGDEAESVPAAGSGKDATGTNDTSTALDSGSATNTTTGTDNTGGENNSSGSTSTTTTSSGSTATATTSSSLSQPSGVSGSTITNLFQGLFADSRGKPNGKTSTGSGSSAPKGDSITTSLLKSEALGAAS